MLRIILCDDDVMCLNSIRKIIDDTMRRKDIKNEIHMFSSIDSLSF